MLHSGHVHRQRHDPAVELLHGGMKLSVWAVDSGAVRLQRRVRIVIGCRTGYCSSSQDFLELIQTSKMYMVAAAVFLSVFTTLVSSWPFGAVVFALFCMLVFVNYGLIFGIVCGVAS